MPKSRLCAVIALGCLIGLCVPARTSPATVNVQDFGAKGDGLTDDTEAIRKAATAAVISFSQQSLLGLYYQTGPVLVFPSGRYLVSDEIKLNCLEVRGEGRAVIVQSEVSKDIFKTDFAWRLKISNLSFMGGKNQLHLTNPNLDTGQIIIDHCRFHYASGFGVYTDVLSTTVKITDCEFFHCNQAWYNGRSDQAIMSDCWIMPNKDMEDKAVIEHRGVRLTLSNIVGVPLVGKPRQRWIDNHGENLTARQFRFGGEGGGFTPIYNYTKYKRTGWGNTIIVDDSFCCANSSYNANCVVYAYELPNSIVIRNSQLVGAAPVMVDKKIKLASYFRNVDPGMLFYKVEGCTGERMRPLPPGLVKPATVKDSSGTPILSAKATDSALAKAKRTAAAGKDAPFTGGSSNGHSQQTDPAKFVDLTNWRASGHMDATSQLNSDWLALAKAGSDMLAVFRQNQPGGWSHITISARVDLDKYHWLTWKQKKATAPGAFSIKVIDVKTGRMAVLYDQVQSAEYDYYARDIKRELNVGGKRDLEIRLYPIASGWKYPSAKAGQFVFYDFMRMEGD